MSSSSSRCMELLLQDTHLLHKAKIRSGFKIPKVMDLTKNRKDYIELTNIEYSPAGTTAMIKDDLAKVMAHYSLDYKPYTER